eukprot:CAMPEP_0170739686 /NCGR_PEP_ID=MMETSP0437-20130122/5292_1 /TAXON_ID=0 /ORGANISM="Sexangularia sp." /LENGTH=57 /DNA_ID=CAMNT_0011078155 /DNA_START=145 /DNA_END=315 /DNA_ORIENTATION=-
MSDGTWRLERDINAFLLLLNAHQGATVMNVEICGGLSSEDVRRLALAIAKNSTLTTL